MAETNKKIRMIIKLMVISIMVAAAILFFIKDKKSRSTQSNNGRAYTEMYKYKDADGIMHYTDIKPQNTDYEVIYMPVSKDKPTVKTTVDKLIGKVLKDKKTDQKTETPQTTAPSVKKAPKANTEPSDQTDFINEAKEALQTVTDYYKDAPKAIDEAKKVKEQVEKVYQDREKAMQELR